VEIKDNEEEVDDEEEEEVEDEDEIKETLFAGDLLRGSSEPVRERGGVGSIITSGILLVLLVRSIIFLFFHVGLSLVKSITSSSSSSGKVIGLFPLELELELELELDELAGAGIAEMIVTSDEEEEVEEVEEVKGVEGVEGVVVVGILIL